MGFNATDELIHRLARPWGAVNRLMLTEADVTAKQIRTRLRSRFLVKLGGAYGVAGFKPTWQRQYRAAELSVRDAAICELAGAKVHELDGFVVVRPEIVVPYTRNVRCSIATVHRSSTPLVTTVQGIRVTTVAQTLFDIVDRVDLRRLERGIDGAILSGKVSVDQLQERRLFYEDARRPGMAIWRSLVDERLEEGWAPPGSELEALLWSAYERVPAAPPARRQAPSWWEPRPGRKDVFVEDWGLILEADGRRWHARVASFDEDRWRDNIAVAHGLRVQRFTYLHLTKRLGEVVELITAAGRRSDVRVA